MQCLPILVLHYPSHGYISKTKQDRPIVTKERYTEVGSVDSVAAFRSSSRRSSLWGEILVSNKKKHVQILIWNSLNQSSSWFWTGPVHGHTGPVSDLFLDQRRSVRGMFEELLPQVENLNLTSIVSSIISINILLPTPTAFVPKMWPPPVVIEWKFISAAVTAGGSSHMCNSTVHW